jgi:hypothetical protein
MNFPIRIIHFCPWAHRLQPAADFLAALPGYDVRRRVSNPSDPALVQMAKLDCEWHGENLRAFAEMRRDGLTFLPAWVFGVTGAVDLLSVPKPPQEAWWLVICGQHPQEFKQAGGRLFSALSRRGIRILYYGFDEASGTMGCFKDIAPYLDVYIHDEDPVAERARPFLRPDCRLTHRSWVANMVPGAAPFCINPDEKIVFLGSQLGLTAHRARQIEFLNKRYGTRFLAICDHSLPVGDRFSLRRYKVSVCPEGRKFGVPAMKASHTDRPFWSGCLGLVPVSEDSREGGRLQPLHEAGLILRYPHGDLAALAAACDRALEAPFELRRRIYDHFNANETIGSVVGAALAQFGECGVPAAFPPAAAA